MWLSAMFLYVLFLMIFVMMISLLCRMILLLQMIRCDGDTRPFDDVVFWWDATWAANLWQENMMIFVDAQDDQNLEEEEANFNIRCWMQLSQRPIALKQQRLSCRFSHFLIGDLNWSKHGNELVHAREPRFSSKPLRFNPCETCQARIKNWMRGTREMAAATWQDVDWRNEELVQGIPKEYDAWGPRPGHHSTWHAYGAAPSAYGALGANTGNDNFGAGTML